MKPVSFLLSLGLSLILWNSSLQAYTDEIGVSPDEAWSALKEMVPEKAIDRQNAGQRELETKWTMDQVRRRRGLLKNYLEQTYSRRYRLKIRLEEAKAGTQVTVTGTFEEKGFGAHRGMPWRSVSPAIEDLDVERKFFYRLLEQITVRRKQSAAVLSKP